MNLAVSTCVRHRKLPEWGLGIVLGVRTGDRKVDVFFENHPSNGTVTMMANPEMLEVTSDPPSDKLAAYQEKLLRPARRSARPRKKALPAPAGTFEDSVDRFVALFPKGFEDPVYLAEERDYKVAAHETFCRLLSREIRVELVREQRVGPMVDAALQIEGETNLISPFEKAAFRDGLQDEKASLAFFAALSALIDAPAPSEALFQAYVKTVETLPVLRGRVFTWPIATLFPFLASPEVHMFVKPVVTRAAALRLGIDIGYESAPNWDTYAGVLKLAETLKMRLADLGCRDMIDVQSFIYRV